MKFLPWSNALLYIWEVKTLYVKYPSTLYSTTFLLKQKDSHCETFLHPHCFKERSVVNVNQWLLLPIQWQKECLIQSAVKKESLFSTYSSIVIPHSCENNADAKWPSDKVTLGQGPSWLYSYALLHLASLCSTLARGLWCFSPSKGNAGLSLQRKGKVHSPSQRKVDLYRQKPLPLDPDWLVFMQMSTPNPCSLLQKALSWLFKMEPFWLVNGYANEYIVA